MAVQRTFSIIKPDAVAKNVVGEIVTRFEKAGLRVVASKMVQLSEREAGGFAARGPARTAYRHPVAAGPGRAADEHLGSGFGHQSFQSACCRHLASTAPGVLFRAQLRA